MAVYLLHAERKYAHAQHYIGWTTDVEARLVEHQAGHAHAGKLPAAWVAAGISFIVARIWEEGDRTFERYLHEMKMSPRLCPVCNPGNTRCMCVPDLTAWRKRFYADNYYGDGWRSSSH
jgi:hypothetical protein